MGEVRANALPAGVSDAESSGIKTGKGLSTTRLGVW